MGTADSLTILVAPPDPKFYLGDRQRALEALHQPDVHVRCQACDVKLGDLRVLR